MDNSWKSQQIKNQIEAIVFNAILMALYKLANEIETTKKDHEMKF